MKTVLIVLLAMTILRGVCAQTAPASPAPLPAQPRSFPPFVDPDQEIKGLALVKALRAGGFVLYMRHADAGEPRPACPNESGLTIQGEDQARTVGTALKMLKIPIAAIRSSETCRTRDTARLLDLGPVVSSADLNPPALRPRVADYAERFKFLLEQPPAGSNILLVSHIQGSAVREDSILIEQAEIAVYLYRGVGKALVVARIPLAAWPGLVSTVSLGTGK